MILETLTTVKHALISEICFKKHLFSFSAWMETVAVNFHDETGEFLRKLKFEAGDDAVGIQWIDVDKTVKLYASHSRLIQFTAELQNAHF